LTLIIKPVIIILDLPHQTPDDPVTIKQKETDLANLKRLKMGRLLWIKRLKKRSIKQITDRGGFIRSLWPIVKETFAIILKD